MSTYIKLPQTIDWLPLRDREWLFINPMNILYSSMFREKIEQNLSTTDKRAIYLSDNLRIMGSYPRFNITDSVYKLTRNELNILPTIKTSLSFADITNNRALELLTKSNDYDNVYVFFSGGLDSTTILTSIIHNWSNADLERVCVVMDSNSISEYPKFYSDYVNSKIRTVSTESFFTEQLMLNTKNIYVTGDCGGPLLTYDNINSYIKMFPDTYMNSWKNHTSDLTVYFGDAKVFNSVAANIPEHLTTVYDFLWWCSFNYGYDIDMYHLVSLYGTLDKETDTETFLMNNQFLWYNTQDYQNWTMYSPADMKINKSNETKLPMRQYIYQFTKDVEYYNNKQIEHSVRKNSKFFKRMPIGIDVDYNIYYRDAPRA